MYYFPLYNWIRKSDCSTELPDFRLEAADSLCRVLQPQLCCLPVVRRSSRTLRLVRCVQIQNSEAYRLEIEENTISTHITSLLATRFLFPQHRIVLFTPQEIEGFTMLLRH